MRKIIGTESDAMVTGDIAICSRWKFVEEIIKIYELTNQSSVLDVGCGKAFLLYEMKLLLPGLTIAGFDISKHGLAESKEEVRGSLFIHKAQDPFPFEDNEFDLTISLGCFHNLKINELQTALSEIERVGRRGYLMLESYRNEQELFNLQCWALTAESFLKFQNDLALSSFWLYEIMNLYFLNDLMINCYRKD